MWDVSWFIFYVLQLMAIRFYTTKRVLHWQAYNDAIGKNRIENPNLP
jgi:hypothetical protein